MITLKKIYALSVLGRLNQDTLNGKKYKEPTMIKKDKYEKFKDFIILLMIFIIFIEGIYFLIYQNL